MRFFHKLAELVSCSIPTSGGNPLATRPPFYNVLLFLFCLVFGAALFAKEKAMEDFRVPLSTLEAIDRRLKTEKNSDKRVQLILRWVKNKEEYEQAMLEKKQELAAKARAKANADEVGAQDSVLDFKNYKEEIVSRIKTELEALERVHAAHLDSLYHVLGFRLLELQKYVDAVVAFEKISARTAEDYMGFGDALFSAGAPAKALDAFERGGLDAKYRNTAAYKRAWCYLQLSQFLKALAEFDIALEENEFTSIELKEEAFRDRSRPYVETFQKITFDEEEFQKLKGLAAKVHSKSPEKAKELLANGMRSLILAFNAKAQVEKAQAVFGFLTKEIQDPTSVLVMAAPIWIKVNRGQLNHEAVEKIVISLPSKKILDLDTAPLQSELYNSIVFYDTLFREDSLPTTRRILFLLNQKFFQLFPDDQNSDPLRIVYAKLLLEDSDPVACMDILARRKGGEKEIEDVALRLDAKCQLKELDQLYQIEHTEFFYARLKQTLLEKKVYERSDLGLSSEAAFESLARMLIGAINKNPKSTYLRDVLAQLLTHYPYSKESKLYLDLQILLAELRFQDVVDSKEPIETRADKFYDVFSTAPRNSDVSKKSLVNSILIGKEVRILERCEKMFQTYSDQFRPGKEVFDRCIRLAEHHLSIEKEYLFWIQLEGQLNEIQQLKVGLMELALDRGRGRKRIQTLKLEAAKRALELWDGSSSQNSSSRSDPRFEKISEAAGKFLGNLKQITFVRIGSLVPVRIKEFEQIDSQIVNFYKSKPPAMFMAKALELRAELASRMRAWMKALPEPAGLTPAELQQYRTKTAEVVKVWEEGAVKRAQECGESAHALSMDYKVSNREVCPEQTPKTVLDAQLEKWKATRQSSLNDSLWGKDEIVEKGETVNFLLEAGAAANDHKKARYFYIRALDLATNDGERALAYLALAKLTNKDSFWETASAFDGNLREPIEWWRKKASGNPYYEKLYDRELGLVR